MGKIKVVIDTCVLVVAGISKSANYAHTVIQKGLSDEIDFYGSDETIEEVKNIFNRPKFKGLLDTPKAQKLLQDYLKKVKQTPLKKEFLDQAKGECKDQKDTPFLALAHQNQCEFITSVDQKDLLSLVSYRSIKILKPADLVKEIQELEESQDDTKTNHQNIPESHNLFN